MILVQCKETVSTSLHVRQVLNCVIILLKSAVIASKLLRTLFIITLPLFITININLINFLPKQYSSVQTC